jgi:hypothetical protein
MSKIVQCQGSPCHLDCREGRDCSEHQPVVISNQGVETLWHPRRADLCLVDDAKAPETETYRIRFMTDAEMSAEGWEPAPRRDNFGVIATVVVAFVVCILGMTTA